MDIRISALEQSLFQACTTITLGNGETTQFWDERCYKVDAQKT
jgi:hypothetical protein